MPGFLDAWGFSSTDGTSSNGNSINVGHTFLILTEVTPTGTISRSVGFYPQEMVYPGYTSAPGMANNDQQHPYNISLTMTVTNSEFFDVLSYVKNTVNGVYDLNNNNCTSFVLGTLNASGLSIPATKGSWAGGGSGYNPGDLGEDIRSMTLAPNMTRDTTINNNRNATNHPNSGDCVL